MSDLDNSILDQVKRHIRNSENIPGQGDPQNPYLDSKGLITIGPGFKVNDRHSFRALDLVNEAGKPATQAEKDQAFDAMIAEREARKGVFKPNPASYENVTSLRMQPDAIEARLGQEIVERAQKSAREIGPEAWSKLTDRQKAVVIDIHYANGSLNDFPKLKEAIQARDAEAMARESHFHSAGDRNWNRLRENHCALLGLDSASPACALSLEEHYEDENRRRQDKGMPPIAIPSDIRNDAQKARRTENEETDQDGQTRLAAADGVDGQPQVEPPGPAEKPIEEAKVQEPERSQAAQAFLDKIARPFDKPALTIALRDPASWTADEAKSVMADYLSRQGNDPFLKQLSDLTGEHMKAIYGEGTLRYDATGKMIDPKPIRPYAPAEQEARTPEGYPLNDAINWAGERVANRIDRHGIEKAISWLQGGLNMIGYKENRLLEDGQFGPETDFAFRKTVAAMGPGRVEDGLALAEFRDYARQAERKNDVSDLAHRTLDIFGPLYRMNPQDEPKHESGALQASLNDLGPKHLGDSWQPLKLDDWIGPKTTQSFADVLSAVGSDTLAQNYGSWLGLIERDEMG